MLKANRKTAQNSAVLAGESLTSIAAWERDANGKAQDRRRRAI
jgi:hypothetical protein